MYIILFFSFQCLCQTTISISEIDYDDVFERKGLVYLKSDESLVTGKVIRYNKNNVAQRYIKVENGKPDDLGWRIISDKAERPSQSLLGYAIVAAAAVAGIATLASGNEIDVPFNSTATNNISSTYIKAQNEKVFNDMSERNDISETLNIINKKSNDTLVEQYEQELISFSESPHDEIKEGPWEEFFYTGQLKRAGIYKNGLKDGIWEEYYENGQLKEKAIFIEGIKDGLWLKYYSNHQLWVKGRLWEFPYLQNRGRGISELCIDLF